MPMFLGCGLLSRKPEDNQRKDRSAIINDPRSKNPAKISNADRGNRNNPDNISDETGDRGNRNNYRPISRSQPIVNNPLQPQPIQPIANNPLQPQPIQPVINIPLQPEVNGPSIDSTHVKAELMPNGSWSYQIKAQVNNVILIYKTNHGNHEIAKDIPLISSLDMSGLDYILLPEDHWFIKENPFISQSDNINITRLILWSKEFIIAKHDQHSILLRVKGPITPPSVKVYDPRVLFPGFGNDRIGQGGGGSIFKVSFNGQFYACKENAHEYKNMERLFFTKAVMPIYGYFKYQNRTYMIMPLGDKSLQKAIEDNDNFSLNEEQIWTMGRFLEANKGLSINASDIKPDNMIITSNELKIIDLSSTGTSRGYSGSPSLKLVQSLLEGWTKKSFTGGCPELHRYHEFDNDPIYQARNIASKDYLQYFYEYYCDKYNLTNDCRNINSFAKVYPLLSKAKLNEYALANNAEWSDSTGTKDQTRNHGGLYGTMVDYPQLKEDNQINWNDYLVHRETIVRGFCHYINNPVYSTSSVIKQAFIELKPRYDALCVDDPNHIGDQLLLRSLNNERFEMFIMDAFAPVVKYNTVRKLLREDNRKEVFTWIIHREAELLPLSDNIRNALIGLLGI